MSMRRFPCFNSACKRSSSCRLRQKECWYRAFITASFPLGYLYFSFSFWLLFHWHSRLVVSCVGISDCLLPTLVALKMTQAPASSTHRPNICGSLPGAAVSADVFYLFFLCFHFFYLPFSHSAIWGLPCPCYHCQ